MPGWGLPVLLGRTVPGISRERKEGAGRMERVEHIDGLYNFRDLGGIRADGGQVRSGLLYRSEALYGLTTEGRRQMEDSPISLVLDLRTGDEAKAMPDPVLDGVEDVHIPMLDGAMPIDADRERSLEAGEEMDAEAALHQSYLSLVAHNGPDYVQVLHRTANMARQGRGTLIHCSAGKDRTGTSIAFLLDLVGADRDQVVADYASSQANLSGAWKDAMLAMIAQSGVDFPKRLEPMITMIPASLIREILDMIDAQYGSVREYLLGNGADPDDIADLKKALVSE